MQGLNSQSLGKLQHITNDSLVDKHTKLSLINTYMGQKYKREREREVVDALKISLTKYKQEKKKLIS